jgi:hypothetical protein
MRLVDDPNEVDGGRCVAVDDEDRVSPINWLAFGRPESAAQNVNLSLIMHVQRTL